MAKTMSVSSTLTTVAQNARQPEPALGRLDAEARLAVAADVLAEMLHRQVQQVEAADQLHPTEGDQIGSGRRRSGPEGEGAGDAVAQGLGLLILGQAEDANRQHHGVVGAQHALEEDQQAGW